jgi:hypothetical protein
MNHEQTINNSYNLFAINDGSVKGKLYDVLSNNDKDKVYEFMYKQNNFMVKNHSTCALYRYYKEFVKGKNLELILNKNQLHENDKLFVLHQCIAVHPKGILPSFLDESLAYDEIYEYNGVDDLFDITYNVDGSVYDFNDTSDNVLACACYTIRVIFRVND